MCIACHLNAVDKWEFSGLDYCIRRGATAKSELMVKNFAHMDPILLLHTKCKRCASGHCLQFCIYSFVCSLAGALTLGRCTHTQRLRACDSDTTACV
jgi:hypothetical protein